MYVCVCVCVCVPYSNHLPVPDIDGSEWRLVVEGEGLRRVVLDLETLQTRFKKHTLAVTVQCSGTR